MQLKEYEAFCLDTCIYILFWYFRLKVEDLDTGMFYYFHILHFNTGQAKYQKTNKYCNNKIKQLQNDMASKYKVEHTNL